PVGPVAEAPDLDAGDLLAPPHQPRARPALDQLAMQGLQPGQLPRVPPRPPPRWLPRGMLCAGPRMPNPPRPPRSSLPCGVDRNPPPPNLPPPPPCPRSCASLTTTARPPKSLPFRSAIADCACASSATSTNANPRERPVSLSVTIFTECTVRPPPSINSRTCFSVTSKGRFPTNSRLPIR